MTFADLGLSPELLKAVEDAGYTTPTAIQAQAIPTVLMMRDLIGIAQTGTGKTASFVLPMIDVMAAGRRRALMPRSLILEPTRELAAQVAENFEKYGKNHDLKMALLIGGVQMGDQLKALSDGVDVLIATPGRLMDLFERGKIMLNGCELLVIDEADRMLDMGFIPDIERITKLVPFTRQTLFFTATMPPEITKITTQFLHNPVRIEASRPATAAATITQLLVASGSKDFEKRETLRKLISTQPEFRNAIIFANRKTEVATLHKSLLRHNLKAVALHGDLDQRARMAALDAFKTGAANLLVASDVAARGLDIPDVSHVFNYDVPHHADDYIHRIGRTGRAGKLGTAISVVTKHDEKSLDAIRKLIGQDIPWSGQNLSELKPSLASDDEEERGGRGRREKSRGGRERGRPAERRPSAERRPAEAAQAVAPAARERTSGTPVRIDEARRAERTARAPKRPDAANDASIRGIEDHLPAFLLRPVKKVASS